MNTRSSFPVESPPPALILLIDRTSSPLWDASVHAVVDEVERRLHPAVVGFAVAAGRGPTLGDACAAARFHGCGEIALVVAPELGADTVSRLLAAAGPAAAGCEVLACDLKVRSIVDRFRHWTGTEPAQAA